MPELKSTNHYENVFLMLTNKSKARADYAGLPVCSFPRISEMEHIIMMGKGERWWLSTRLLLGLSHDEAVKMGRELRDFYALAAKISNKSTMRLDSLGLILRYA